MPPRSKSPFTHPLWWLALVALLLNDHVLKLAAPSLLTGKLSDVAGLIVAPAVVALAFPLASPRRRAWLAAILVGVGFAAINLLPAAAHAVELMTAWLGVPWRIWVDPSDLLALPALALGGWLVAAPSARPRAQSSPFSPWLHRLGACLGAAACLASSATPPPRPLSSSGMVAASEWHGRPLQLVDAASGRAVNAYPIEGNLQSATLFDGTLFTLRSNSITAYGFADGNERTLHQREDGGRFHANVLADRQGVYAVSAPPPGHAHERLMAFDPNDGKVTWSVALPSAMRHRDASQYAALGAGLLVVPAGDQLIAVEPTRGRRAWAYAVGAEAHFVVVHGPHVFCGDAKGNLHAVDARTGHGQWQLPTGSEAAFTADDWPWYGASKLAAVDGLLIFKRGDQLVAFDAVTRKQHWVADQIGAMTAAPGGVFVELAEEETFALLDPQSGREIWRRTIADVEGAAVVDAEQSYVLVRRDEELRAYELTDGQLRWRYDLEDGQTLLLGDET